MGSKYSLIGMPDRAVPEIVEKRKTSNSETELKPSQQLTLPPYLTNPKHLALTSCRSSNTVVVATEEITASGSSCSGVVYH
jgi:hypothetical protein